LRLAALAPGAGAAPAALTHAETLRQRWAAGRLAERRGDRAAAIAHFEAVQLLCSSDRGARAAAGADADSAAGAQGAGSAAESDAAAAPALAAPPGAAGAAAAPDGDADGSGGAPAGAAGAGPGREAAQQAAGEVRVRGAGGGCEGAISAAAAAARLELLALRGLLDGGRAALAAGPAAAAALAARLAPALLGGTALAAQLAGDRRALLQALALLQARTGTGFVESDTHTVHIPVGAAVGRATCASSTRALPDAAEPAVCGRPA